MTWKQSSEMWPLPWSLCGCQSNIIYLHAGTIFIICSFEDTKYNLQIPSPIYTNLAFIQLYICKAFTKIFYFSFLFAICIFYKYLLDNLYPWYSVMCGSHINDQGNEYHPWIKVLVYHYVAWLFWSLQCRTSWLYIQKYTSQS